MSIVLSGDSPNLTGANLSSPTITSPTINSAPVPTVNGTAPLFGARAWGSFVGSSGSIAGSGNVSGVTRNSTGNYTVTFSTAMPDANYAIMVTPYKAGSLASPFQQAFITAKSTTTFTIVTTQYTGSSNNLTNADFDNVFFVIFC